MNPARRTASAIAAVQAGQVLSRTEAAEAFLPVLDEAFPGADTAWGALCAALYARGPTTGELLGLVDAVLAYDPDLAKQLRHPMEITGSVPVVAVAGSGEETFKTFNVSTAAVFVRLAPRTSTCSSPLGDLLRRLQVPTKS